MMRMMPFAAILQHDLRTLWESRLVRLWLAATALLTLFLLATNWGHFQTAPLVGSLLFPYLVFPWFLVVIVLGIMPVSGARAEALADGFLSRPVNRHEYLLATWLARVSLVLGVYLIVVVPAIVLVVMADRPAKADPVTLYGLVAAVGVVGLVLTFLVSLGFLLGTLLRKPLLAVVVLVFVWFPINLVLNVFALEEFSPISLNQAIPTLVRQPWRATEADSPNASSQAELEALSRQAANFMNVLSGAAQQPAGPPSDQSPAFFERNEFDDFSLVRVMLGYGVPTLLAVGLATLCFCVRDV